MSDEQTIQPAMVWNGPLDLGPLLVPIDDVELDARNARKHPEANLEAIKRSIETFGQLKPIVVKGRRILAGNGTHIAIKALGWTHIARTLVPEGMTDSEAIAFALADNKTSDLSEWDFQEVSALLKELPAELLDVTGFSELERGPLMRGTPGPSSDQSGDVKNGHDVIVSVADERAQRLLLEELSSRGFACRAVVY